MIINDDTHLLFVEPMGAPTAPIVDDYTRRVTAAWRARIDGRGRSRGQHQCTGRDGAARRCKATSGNGDHTVVGGLETNSLAIHYIACHRADVPDGELAKIAALPSSDLDPTDGEVAGDWRACDTAADRGRR